MTDIIAVLIAAIALFVAIWNSVTTRKHNQLSVKPHMNIYEYFFSDWSGLYISNIGLGPAIIKSFSVFVDGKVIPGNSLEIWNNAFTNLGFTDIFSQMKLVGFQTGHTISNSEPIRLVELNVENESSEDEYNKNQKLLRSALKKIKIEIEYTSMYENNLWNCTWPKSKGI